MSCHAWLVFLLCPSQKAILSIHQIWRNCFWNCISWTKFIRLSWFCILSFDSYFLFKFSYAFLLMGNGVTHLVYYTWLPYLNKKHNYLSQFLNSKQGSYFSWKITFQRKTTTTKNNLSRKQQKFLCRIRWVLTII